MCMGPVLCCCCFLWGGGTQLMLPQILYSIIEGHFAKDCACVEWILLWYVRQTRSGFHRHYTQTSTEFLILLKRLKCSWICFIILIDLYTAHHNSLGICHQLNIRHLYVTFYFLTRCICMGTGSLFVYRLSSFSWKGAPSTKEKRICGSVNCLPILPRRVMHFLPRNQNCLFFYSNIEVGAHELQVTLGKIFWQAHTPMIIINIIIIMIILTIVIIIFFFILICWCQGS